MSRKNRRNRNIQVPTPELENVEVEETLQTTLGDILNEVMEEVEEEELLEDSQREEEVEELEEQDSDIPWYDEEDETQEVVTEEDHEVVETVTEPVTGIDHGDPSGDEEVLISVDARAMQRLKYL